MTFVLEVPEEHHVHRHGVLIDQVLNDPLGGRVNCRGNDGQPMAGVQFLRRWSVEALLERLLERAALAVAEAA